MAISAVVSVVSAAASTYVAAAVTLIAESAIIGSIAGAVVGGVVASQLGNAIGGGGGASPSSVGAEQARGILINAASSIDPLRIIYGSRRTGGTYVVPPFASGASNEYLHLVIALCEGEISAINTVYLDDLASTDARYAGLVTIEKFTGTDTQAASALLLTDLPGWIAAHQGKGVAYVHVKIKYSADAFSSIPTITCDIDGKRVYDPRDLTVKFSNNPALGLRDYLTSTRYGRGIASSLIDDASIIVAANHCDEMVAVPTGTQLRYTCDGIVDVDQTVYANVLSLIASCRGMLIFSGGFYRLVIDKAETPSSFVFNEDNITGAWQFFRPGKRDKVNKITASYFNPDNNWQPDFSIQSSATYLAEDNALSLERKIDLPYTANGFRASHIAQLEMKSSRFATTVQFSAFQDGLKCEVGDVVLITHTTPGWTNKPFRVLTIDILDIDNVSITAREYDAAAYTLDALDAIDSAPQTMLPDVFAVGVPGNLRVTESKYQTTGSAGVKARATVAWDAPTDAFVTSYALQYRPAGTSTWTDIFDIRGTTLPMDDIAPAIYEFRVKSVNIAGASSSYSPILTVQINGLLDTPADITGFAVRVVSGQAQATLDQHPDLDVRIGGRIVVRWSPLTSSTTWQDGVLLSPDGFPGDSSSFFLPLLGGTYLAKARDSTGHLSENAVAFTLSDAHLTGFNTLGTVTEHPAFSGAASNVAAVDAGIQLSGTTLWDDIPDIDAASNIDSLGGIVTSGSYQFASRIDLGSVITVRLFPHLKSLGFDVGDNWDARTTNMDNWGLVDGVVIEDAEVALEVRTTNDDPAGAPTWAAWHALPGQADYTARAFEFRTLFNSADPTHNRRVTELSVAAKQPI